MSEQIVEVKEVRTKETVIADIKATLAAINNMALIGAIKIGADLKSLKKLVPHGNWLEYIEENLQFNKRKVQRFIQISEAYGDENTPFSKLISNASTLTHLSVSKALQLLAVEENQVETFVETVEVDKITSKQLEEEIERYKQSNSQLKKEIDITKEAISEAESRIKELEEAGATITDIEEEKAKQEELKAKIKLLEAGSQEKIQEAVEEAKAELNKELEEAMYKINDLEGKLSNVANESILKFKVYMETFQQSLINAKETIKEVAVADQEKANKMNKAIVTVIEKVTADIR